MASPRLSVLMPARNAVGTIRSAVGSVLRHLPDDSELLVLDDASEDGTGEFIARLARRDRRVRVITSDAPSGWSGAGNKLLAATEAPLIARMDSDDISMAWRFRTQLRALEQHRLDAVFAPAVMVGPSRFSVVPQPPIAASPAGVPFELLLVCPMIHSSMLARREAVLLAGGYRTVPSEDWDLYMRMVLDDCRLARLATPSVIYRKHANQITADQGWHAALAIDSAMSATHRALAGSLLGLESDSFAAFAGPRANAAELGLAVELIDQVRKAASRLGVKDRTAVGVALLTARSRINQRYPSTAGPNPRAAES